MNTRITDLAFQLADSTAHLTAADFRGYSSRQVLENTSNSGMSPRKSVAFFTSIGITPMGGMERNYKTRKGNTVRRLFAVFNILPTLRENRAEVSNRSNAMSAAQLCARDSRTIARALRILEKTFRPDSEQKLSTTAAAKDYLRLRLAPLEHEEFHALWLDSRNMVIAIEPLFRGTLGYCTIHPREVLKSALRCNAASVIVAHNHPGGSASPSPEDINLTKVLRSALKVIDVRLVDHIIVTAQGATSLAEQGAMA